MTFEERIKDLRENGAYCGVHGTIRPADWALDNAERLHGLIMGKGLCSSCDRVDVWACPERPSLASLIYDYGKYAVEIEVNRDSIEWKCVRGDEGWMRGGSSGEVRCDFKSVPNELETSMRLLNEW